MKRLWFILVLALGAFLFGCHGVIDTYAQRQRRIRNESDYLARQFVDDCDLFWLADRPMQLTEWHIRDAD